jgi:hypothetical protein
MTSSVEFGCTISAPRTFLGCCGTLLCIGSGRSLGLFFRTVTTINANFAVMNFAVATIRLASVALLTKQLNIRSVALASTGEWYYVIIFQVYGTAAAFADTAISCINNLLRSFRNMTALTKTN